MPFDPAEAMKTPINVPATNYTAAETIESVDQLKAWVDRAIARGDQLSKSMAQANPVGPLLSGELFEPFYHLRQKLNDLDPDTSTKADLSSFWRWAKEKVSDISNGASVGANSPIANAATRINSQWSMFGYLASATGYKADGGDPSTHTLTHQNYRTDMAAGSAVAAQLGFVPSDPPLFEMRKLREATKNASHACAEVERLREQNQTEARDWEKVRTDAAAETDARVLSLIQAKKDELEQLYKDHDARMATIEENFEKRLVLGGPATYWKERARDTFKAAMLALAAFVLLVAGFIFIASTIGPEHVKHVLGAIQPDPITSEGTETATEPLGVGSTLLGFALISTPAVMALWVLMLISRIFRENFHLSNDARHRHMLITTYLALAEDDDNPVDEHDRQYALNAIFSVPTEASKDDALTAMGGMLNRR